MVKLEKLSEEMFDEKYYENIGFHSDGAYEIVDNQSVIGIIMIANNNPHYGNECVFIEWVEIGETYRENSIFSRVLEMVFELYNTEEIHFECSDDKLPMYIHLGAEVIGISELTENNMLILKKESFVNRTRV